jgi:hypothetical protein
MLGNWAKTFYPQNVGANDFVKVSVNKSSGRCFVRIEKVFAKVFCYFCMIHWLSDVMRNDHQISVGSRVYSLFQVSRNLSNSGITAKETSENIADSRTSADSGRFCFEVNFGVSSWEPQQLEVFADMKEKPRMSRAKGAVPKVRVWGVNRWQACNCVKLAPQITGCKRRSCTCSHYEYSSNSRVISECKSPFVSL